MDVVWEMPASSATCAQRTRQEPPLGEGTRSRGPESPASVTRVVGSGFVFFYMFGVQQFVQADVFFGVSKREFFREVPDGLLYQERRFKKASKGAVFCPLGARRFAARKMD